MALFSCCRVEDILNILELLDLLEYFAHLVIQTGMSLREQSLVQDLVNQRLLYGLHVIQVLSLVHLFQEPFPGTVEYLNLEVGVEVGDEVDHFMSEEITFVEVFSHVFEVVEVQFGTHVVGPGLAQGVFHSFEFPEEVEESEVASHYFRCDD